MDETDNIDGGDGMEATFDLRYDARRAQIRFSPLGNGRFLLCAPDADTCISLYISEAQAQDLYRLLRLYLRNPLTRWGPEAVETPSAAPTSRASKAGR